MAPYLLESIITITSKGAWVLYDRIRSMSSDHEIYTSTAQKYCTFEKRYSLCEVFDLDFHKLKYLCAETKIEHSHTGKN